MERVIGTEFNRFINQLEEDFLKEIKTIVFFWPVILFLTLILGKFAPNGKYLTWSWIPKT